MLVLFLGIMGIFAVGVGWLGRTFLEQDRELDEQRILERLDGTADIVVAELRTGLTRLDQQLETLKSLPPADVPEAAKRAGDELPAGAVIVRADRSGVTAYPGGRLLYYPTLPDRPGPPPATFAAGERLEFGGQYGAAAAAYGQLTASDDDAIRAGALLRLARVYRKAGQTGDAADAYDELAAMRDTPVEGLPSGLLALGARCGLLDFQANLPELAVEARRLRDGLMSGIWTIDRATFLMYSEDADAFLARAAGEPGGEGPSEVAAAEVDGPSYEALELASGVEEMWREWSSGANEDTITITPPATSLGIDGFAGVQGLAMWRGTSDSAVGLVGAPSFVQSRLIDPLAPSLERQSAALILGGLRSEETLGLRARRPSRESGLPWELQIVSADPIADRDRQVRRRRLLLSVASLVGVLVVAGTYFSSRAVASELEVARLQSDFVSAVSHDFRTPLTSLRQVTDALAGDRVDEDRRRDYYDIQRRGIERLHRLVEGLLDFGRMEAGAREFERRPIAARRWIEGLVGDFQLEVAKQGYTVELSWDSAGDPAGVDVEIEGDEPALTRAVWNVLDNAIKYSPDCKAVWVDCRHDAGGMTVSVRDRGLGIDPAERLEIFGKFVRGTAAASGTSSGTGLGLATVRHIVRAHGGHIEIEGGTGEGTTFNIRLPARQAS